MELKTLLPYINVGEVVYMFFYPKTGNNTTTRRFSLDSSEPVGTLAEQQVTQEELANPSFYFPHKRFHTNSVIDPVLI